MATAFFSTGVLIVCVWLSVAHPSRGEQLVLAEGEENHEIACQAPDAVNYIIIWAVNETAIHNEYMGFKVGEQKAVADGMKERSITFVPTADVNRTTLRCVVTDVLNVDNIFPPKECIIIIQGILSAPVVDYYMRDQSVLFKWTAPFSHDITGVERDISHYVVNIINMADHSVLSDNTTHTEYLLEPGQCHFNEYQVEIAAVNIVGVGEKYTSPSFHLEELSVFGYTIDLYGDHPLVSLMIHTNCLYEIKFNFELIPTYSNSKIQVSNTSTGQRALTLSSEAIKFNEWYTAIVSIEGAPSFHHNFTLSTFGVQSVEVTEYSDYAHLICHFALRSRISQCTIIIKPLTHASNVTSAECEYMYTATRRAGASQAAAVLVLPNGDYTLDVFDGGTATGHPAHSLTLVISHSPLNETSRCADKPEKRTEMDIDADCQCSSFSMLVAVAVILALLALLTLVLALSILLCFLQRKKSCRNVLPADKEQQEKYDVEDNPVYAICGKSQHHKKRSSVAHEYETVVPATKDTCSS